MKTIVIAAALLAVWPAHTAAGQAQAEVRVSHAGLNLTTETGIRALDRRIAAAAEAVCPDVHSFPDLSRQAVARRCIALAIGNARPQRDRILAASRTTWMLADRTR